MKIQSRAQIVFALILFPCIVMGQSQEKPPTLDGCHVEEIAKGSAAEAAGLALGDVIVEVNQSPIRSSEDLRASVTAAASELSMVVHRGTTTVMMNAHLPQEAANYRLGVGCSPAETPSPTNKKALITPKIGISPYTGLLGLEVQHGHFAFDVGLPTSGGVRYYFRPRGHSWFAGLYGTGFGFDRDETIDGVPYTHYSTIGGGSGGGYRWLWHSGWNLELGLALGYRKETWTSPSAEKKSEQLILWPVGTIGYSF